MTVTSKDIVFLPIILFGAECFYGVLFSGDSRRNQSRDKGQQHAYEHQYNSADKGQGSGYNFDTGGGNIIYEFR